MLWYVALSLYLDSHHDEARGLALGKRVLERLEDYPPEQLVGRLSVELVSVIDDIAKRQLLLRQYEAAETFYQKVLFLWLGNKSYDADTIRKRSGLIFHNLGIVAEEQRRWGQAEDYYQKALAINIEFNDSHGQASTYHQLGMVAEEQERWVQALDYYLKALPVFIEFNDEFSVGIVLESLAYLWQASQDSNLLAAVGSVLQMPVEEVEEMLGKLN